MYQRGRYEEAEPLYKEVLAVYRKNLLSNHREFAVYLNNLAVLYNTQGRYVEAEALINEVLALRRKNLPENHPDVANSLNNLAAVYHKQGRYVEAEVSYKEAVVILRIKFGDDHPNTKFVAENLKTFLAEKKERTAFVQHFKLPTSLSKQRQYRLKRPK